MKCLRMLNFYHILAYYIISLKFLTTNLKGFIMHVGKDLIGDTLKHGYELLVLFQPLPIETYRNA